MEARIDHVALWVNDLETMRAFCAEVLPGECGGLYHSPEGDLVELTV